MPRRPADPLIPCSRCAAVYSGGRSACPECGHPKGAPYAPAPAAGDAPVRLASAATVGEPEASPVGERDVFAPAAAICVCLLIAGFLHAGVAAAREAIALNRSAREALNSPGESLQTGTCMDVCIVPVGFCLSGARAAGGVVGVLGSAGLAVLASFCFAFALLYLVPAAGLLRRRRWVRWVGMVLVLPTLGIAFMSAAIAVHEPKPFEPTMPKHLPPGVRITPPEPRPDPLAPYRGEFGLFALGALGYGALSCVLAGGRAADRAFGPAPAACEGGE